MIKTRTLSVTALGMFLFMLPIQAQDRPAYRDFRLGSPLVQVLSQVHLAASDVSLVHERPALMQDVRWTTPYFMAGTIAPQTDPVQQIVFSFFDDQLFRVAVTYERDRTEGMTDADMIAAVSRRYGSPVIASKPVKTPIFATQAAFETSAHVAQWGEGDVLVVLSRSVFTRAFELVVTSSRLDALARTANAEAIRLDEREAPARDTARRKQDADDARLANEKTRLANKEAFQP